MSDYTDEEKYCIDMIDQLKREYERAIEPYIVRLANLVAMRGPKPMYLPADVYMDGPNTWPPITVKKEQTP